MKELLTFCYIILFCAIAGCEGAQVPTTGVAPTATTMRRASGTYNCPALSGGTGILADGDFSQAPNPGTQLITYNKGQVFAPYWQVSERTIDFNGSAYWKVDGLCSVDLDGYHTVGGITTSAFPTKSYKHYLVTFVLSGNGFCPPTIKKMKIAADKQFTTFTWDTTSGHDAQHGEYRIQTWEFTATKRLSVLRMTSQDAKASSCGAVVAGIAVMKA